jgi:hypothetical protein
MEYIKIDDLLEEVYNEGLDRYRKSNQIDDSVLYGKIDECIAFVKQPKILKCVTIKVSNYKADLPADFFKCKLLYQYKEEIIILPYGNNHQEYVEVCEPRTCEEPKISCDGTLYYIDQHFTNYGIRYKSVEPLSLDKCKPNSVSIENNELTTPFECSNVYCLYYSTEGNGLIPDIPKIKEAIKTIVIYHGFRYLYLKGMNDLIQRVQYMERLAAIAYNVLQTYKDKLSFKDMQNLKNMKVSLYNAKKNK